MVWVGFEPLWLDRPLLTDELVGDWRESPVFWLVGWIGGQVSAAGKKVLPNAPLVGTGSTNAVHSMTIRR
jgi:hypothetical protein